MASKESESEASIQDNKTLSPQNEDAVQGRRRKPKHDFPQTQAGKLWDAFGNPEEPVNTMPGGTYNTAGGRPPDYTWKEVFTFGKVDFERFYKGGCSRDALLVGIGAGGAVGGTMWILRGMRHLMSAANWSVGAFSTTALGMYTWCEHRRRQEAQGMAQAVAGMKRLQERKKQEEKEAREKAVAAARQAEEERRKKSWTNLSNYKFW